MTKKDILEERWEKRRDIQLKHNDATDFSDPKIVSMRGFLAAIKNNDGLRNEWQRIGSTYGVGLVPSLSLLDKIEDNTIIFSEYTFQFKKQLAYMLLGFIAHISCNKKKYFDEPSFLNIDTFLETLKWHATHIIPRINEQKVERYVEKIVATTKKKVGTDIHNDTHIVAKKTNVTVSKKNTPPDISQKLTTEEYKLKIVQNEFAAIHKDCAELLKVYSALEEKKNKLENYVRELDSSPYMVERKKIQEEYHKDIDELQKHRTTLENEIFKLNSTFQKEKSSYEKVMHDLQKEKNALHKEINDLLLMKNSLKKQIGNKEVVSLPTVNDRTRDLFELAEKHGIIVRALKTYFVEDIIFHHKSNTKTNVTEFPLMDDITKAEFYLEMTDEWVFDLTITDGKYYLSVGSFYFHTGVRSRLSYPHILDNSGAVHKENGKWAPTTIIFENFEDIEKYIDMYRRISDYFKENGVTKKSLYYGRINDVIEDFFRSEQVSTPIA